jgi:FkbM family methyltransferase
MARIEILGRVYEIDGSPDDAYFGHFAGTGKYTDDLTEFLRRTIRAHSVCVDVGANIGLSSIFMAACAPGVRVLAIEPSPTTFASLQANITRTGFRDMEALQVALAAGDGTAEFLDLPRFLAGSHLVGAAPGHPTAVGIAPIIVRCTTLDELDRTRPLGRVDLLKIDAEGAELPILAGATRVLATYRPITVVEFNAYVLVTLQGLSGDAFLDALFRTFDDVHVIDKGSGETRRIDDTPEARAAFLVSNAAGGGIDNLACTFREMGTARSLERGDLAR